MGLMIPGVGGINVVEGTLSATLAIPSNASDLGASIKKLVVVVSMKSTLFGLNVEPRLMPLLIL